MSCEPSVELRLNALQDSGTCSFPQDVSSGAHYSGTCSRHFDTSREVTYWKARHQVQSWFVIAGGLPEAHGAVCTEVAPQDRSVLCHSGRGGSLQNSGSLFNRANRCDASAHLRHLSIACIAAATGHVCIDGHALVW